MSNITLINDRMENVIDDLKFDYIITDPPYNIGYKYNDYNDKMNEDEYINLFTKFQALPTIIIHYPEAICNLICEGIGRVNKIVSWCYNNNASFKAHRAVAFFNCNPDFNKVKQQYKDLKDKRNIKLIENGSTGCRSYDWFSDIQLVKNRSKEKIQGFTNQIPVKLMERIILLTTNEGDVICDPFMGTGTTGEACINTNRRFIGIEQSEQHFKIASDRLKAQDSDKN